MRKMLKHFWHDLVDDEQAARRVTRALLLGYAASAGPLGVMLPNTTAKITVFVTGGLAGIFGGLISVSGTPDQVLTKVETAQAARAAVPPATP